MFLQTSVYLINFFSNFSILTILLEESGAESEKKEGYVGKSGRKRIKNERNEK